MMWVNWVVQAERPIDELNSITLPEYWLFMAGQAYMHSDADEEVAAVKGAMVTNDDALNQAMGPVLKASQGKRRLK